MNYDHVFILYVLFNSVKERKKISRSKLQTQNTAGFDVFTNILRFFQKLQLDHITTFVGKISLKVSCACQYSLRVSHAIA